MAFGGSPRCRHDALLNDGGFASVVRDGAAGYELWGGGSLGRSPHLAVQLHEFVPRGDVLAAAEALVDVFVKHGDLDHPAKARLKFVVDRLGEERFRAEWSAAFEHARQRPHPDPAPVSVLGNVEHARCAARDCSRAARVPASKIRSEVNWPSRMGACRTTMCWR